MIPLLLLFGACEPVDPLDEAWNQVFEITATATADGCEEPAPEPVTDAGFVAIGLGMWPGEEEDLFVATAYLCTSPTTCSATPFANAFLDTATEEQLHGYFGENAYASDRACIATWTGIDATRTASGRLHLAARNHQSETFTETSDGCDGYLDSLYGEVCDQTLVIDATLVSVD